ncbi:O-antigen ligase family protein [Methylobacter sp.]|uniref:O-antigen ligase family protein n=1 Tax=Methylobacter sp. TaxID=2051955 RepID=UPI001206FD1C|nr:O-antigen ligase family protein [Methylobacter sp.]TAK62648.1 MAG: O-antigen ligase family protein [Methylobacter sp.]
MKLNPIINDDQTARIENTLLISALALFPLLYLTLRGWTNTLTFVLFGLSIVHFFRLPRSEWSIKNISATEWAVIVALASGFLAILISQLLRQDLVAKAYDGPLRMLLAAPVFLLLLKKKTDFIQIFQYICPLSLLILLVFVHSDPVQIQKWGGRFTTYFVDPNAFGINTMLLAFLCLFSIDAVGKDGVALRLLKYTGVLAGFYLEMKSQTRGAWVAEPVMLVLWTAIHWQSKSIKRLLISALISVLTILSFYFFIDFFQDRVNSIYHEISSWLNKTNTDTSTGLRLSMWQMSWVLFKQAPFCGYGDLGYQSQLLMPQIQSAFSQEAISTMRSVGPHNEYFANMVRSGIFGLIAVLMQFFVPGVVFIQGLKSSIQGVKSASIMGLSVVIGMMITGLSVEVLTLKYTNSFYGLMIAALCATVLWKRPAEI